MFADLKASLRRRFPRQWYAYTRWRSNYVEPELAYLEKIVPRGRASVDVGANIGEYTRKLAILTTRVHAFEPIAELADFLSRTCPPNVTVHDLALSDHAGTAELKIPLDHGRRAYGLATLEARPPADEWTICPVPLARLDDVLGADIEVGFLKVDVEGHELAVLRGAEQLIRRCRPTLLVECEERHHAGGTTALFAYLNGLGYSGGFLRDGNLRDLSEFDATRDQRWGVSDPYIYNFLLFPRPRQSWAPRGKLDQSD
jgi:FkbM family methyltransferase